MKKSAKIIPMFISVILLSLLFLNNLKIELTVPSKGWSRPIDLHTASKYPVNIYSYEQNGNTDILFPTGTETLHISVNNKLHVNRHESLPVSGDTSLPFWFENGKMVYQKNNELYFYDGQETKISDGITAFAGKASIVMFAVDKNLYRFDSETKNHELISTFEYPISKILISKNTEDILVLQDDNEFSRNLALLHQNKQLPIGEINLGSSVHLDEIDFDIKQNKGLIIYETMSIVQGVRKYIPYFLPFNIDTDLKVKAKKWNIEDDSISSPRNFNVSLTNGTSVLFTALGPTKGKKSKVNVYEANLDSTDFSMDKVVVTKRSISNTTATKPFHLNKNGSSIAWFGYDGEKYGLLASTTDSEIVKKANKANSTDYKTAVLESVTNIFSAVLVLFFALTWLLPPTIIYAIMFFVQGHRFESYNSWWLIPFSFITYLGAQIYFFNNQFSKNTMFLAPDYLKIPNNFIIWPILLGLLSYLVYSISKQKDTSHFMGLSYIIGINLLFVSLLVGVYVF